MGRHSDYTPEIADEICASLLEADEQGRCLSLRRICANRGLAIRTVFDWLDAHEEFRTKYARARELQAELEVDAMQEIADDGRNDWMEKLAADGESRGWFFNGEAAARSKIRLEQRRWYAEKLLPKKYGSRTVVAGDPDAPIGAAALTDAQLAIIAAGGKP